MGALSSPLWPSQRRLVVAYLIAHSRWACFWPEVSIATGHTAWCYVTDTHNHGAEVKTTEWILIFKRHRSVLNKIVFTYLDTDILFYFKLTFRIGVHELNWVQLTWVIKWCLSKHSHPHHHTKISQSRQSPTNNKLRNTESQAPIRSPNRKRNSPKALWHAHNDKTIYKWIIYIAPYGKLSRISAWNVMKVSRQAKRSVVYIKHVKR